MKTRGVLGLVFLVAILIGLNFSILKFALDHTTPILLASMRTVIGGSFLLAFAKLRGEKLPTRRDDLLNIFIVSLSITTISSAFLIIGVSRVASGLSSLISSTVPLFTAVLAYIMLKSKTSGAGAVGLVVGFVGAAVLASPSIGGGSAAWGAASLAFSALAWAFGITYMNLRDFSRVSPIMLVGVQLYMSAIVLVPVALVVEGTTETEWGLGLLLPLLYAAIPANAVTFSLMALIVKRGTATQASATAYLIPVFGVFFAWLIHGEVLGVTEGIGAVLVVVGVYLVVTAGAKQRLLAPAE